MVCSKLRVLVSLAVSIAFVLGVRPCEFGPVIYHPVNKELVPAVNSKGRHIITMFLPTPSARTALRQLIMTTKKLGRSVKEIFLKQSSYFIYKVQIKNNSSCGRLCR